VFAGGRLIGGSAQLLTEERVANSYLTKLWNHEAFQNNDKELKLTTFADKISPYFTIAVLGIAFLSGSYWLQTTGMDAALSVFTAVLIIACPCALALSTPFTLGSALNVLSLNGLFVKNHLLIENLSKASTVVFDKTGTLTNSETSDVEYFGHPLSPNEKSLLGIAASNSIHPLSRKIADITSSPDSQKPDTFHEIPGKGIYAILQGQTVCMGSRQFIIDQTTLIKDQVPESDFIGSTVHVAIDNNYRGYFGIKAGLRDGITDLLKELKQQVSMYLISGDNEGQRKEFETYFQDNGSLLFNRKPEEKLDFITELQNNDQSVIMVGDGLNDAGALKKSDFGIALADDVSSFAPACDAILEGGSLNKLKSFINFSQKSMNIIIASFVLSLLYNTVGLGFAITGHLSPLVAAVLMPLSSISVMVFTFLTTRYFARKGGLAIWK
jgi:Cu+-exporting ATPase